MGHFYGTLKGRAGQVSRLGTAKSGITAHIRGWNLGVRVECLVTPDGDDVIYVTETGGSNDPNTRKLITILGDKE